MILMHRSALPIRHPKMDDDPHMYRSGVAQGLVIGVLVASAALFGIERAEATSEVGTPAPLAAATQPQDREPVQVMMDVLTHPRCVNCHPAGDKPHVTDASVAHRYGVQRGADNHGLPALGCSTCHQEENNDNSGVPGAPDWGLAPRSMAWEGLSRTQIARSMLDPARNGGRSLQEIVDHLTQDELVLWAWEPGVRQDGTSREPPPVPVDEYIRAVEAWARAGAPIPESPEGSP